MPRLRYQPNRTDPSRHYRTEADDRVRYEAQCRAMALARADACKDQQERVLQWYRATPSARHDVQTAVLNCSVLCGIEPAIVARVLGVV